MWQIVIGAVAGAAAGGITSYLNTEKRAGAYKEAADAIKSAAEEYSGQKAYGKIQSAGQQEGMFQANAFGYDNKPITGNLSLQNINGQDTANTYAEGANAGRGMEAKNLDAKYNAATAQAKLNLEQANREANAQQAAVQAGFNTAGGLADLYKNSGIGTAKKKEE